MCKYKILSVQNLRGLEELAPKGWRILSGKSLAYICITMHSFTGLGHADVLTIQRLCAGKRPRLV